MNVSKGFLRLSDDQQVYQPSKQGRITCGGGSCLKVKVERDEEGALRIGPITLAPHCHLAFLVFGVCFLAAGVILTGLAYSSSSPDGADSERVAGPSFLLVGFLLLILGVVVILLLSKLNATQESFVPLESPTWSNGQQYFSDNFSATRRSTLSTITQAVPVGFFLTECNGRPGSPSVSRRSASLFTEVQLSSPPTERKLNLNGETRSNEDGLNLPALALRPSLPLPLFSSNVTLGKSRSDQPFGSIASLQLSNGEVASFPTSRNNANSASNINSNNYKSQSPSSELNGMPPIRVDDTPLQSTKSEMRSEDHEVPSVA